jgi:hypothetical protein
VATCRRYLLDMAQPLHRVVLSRLLHLSAVEGTWARGAQLHNFRNVIVDHEETPLGDPTRFRLPPSGWIQLDYLEYSPWVAQPSAIELHRRIAERERELMVRGTGSIKESPGLQPAVKAEVDALVALLSASLTARRGWQGAAWAAHERLAAQLDDARPGGKKGGKRGKRKKSIEVAAVAGAEVQVRS